MGGISVGIVGYGKIAQDEHVGAIGASDDFFLHSVADPGRAASTVRHYADIDEMLDSPDIPDAVVVCTPPQMRFDVASRALHRHLHVMLEKPPCVTAEEVETLGELAQSSRLTLFCAWHSRFAPAVGPAHDWLSLRRVRRVHIDWREDVRVWHPGQAWIWQPGGFGVFDAGINALSIAAGILPNPLVLRDALLRIPEDCHTPISAELELTDDDGLAMSASFDFLQAGRQTWEIEIETDRGQLKLIEGGNRLVLDGRDQRLPVGREYAALYRRFSRLIAAGQSDIDLTPLRLVQDALQHGRRELDPPLSALFRQRRQ